MADEDELSPSVVDSFANAMMIALSAEKGQWADKLRDCLNDVDAHPTGCAACLDHPVLGLYLDRCLSALSDQGLGGVALTLANRLSWYQIFEGDGIDPVLSGGLLAGQIIGKKGIINADGVYAGLFLLAPGIHYPLHQHPALEVYAILSGTVTIHHGRSKPGMEVTPGEISITPPHQVHSLTTGNTPCLIAYLWTGDLTGENWFWIEDDTGEWRRQCWSRQPEGHWVLDREVPLLEADISKSGDNN